MDWNEPFREGKRASALSHARLFRLPDRAASLFEPLSCESIGALSTEVAEAGRLALPSRLRASFSTLTSRGREKSVWYFLPLLHENEVRNPTLAGDGPSVRVGH